MWRMNDVHDYWKTEIWNMKAWVERKEIGRMDAYA